MTEINLTDEQIEELFRGTDFGPSSKTNIGRRGLMVDCVLKRAAGYHVGATMKLISLKAGILTFLGDPTKSGLRWAYLQLFDEGNPETILERLSK